MLVTFFVQNVRDSSAFLLVGGFKLQCLFCILALQPLLARCESSLQSAWCLIIAGDTFNFDLFISQLGVFQCLSLSLHVVAFHFALEPLAPSWCCACFGFRVLYTCNVMTVQVWCCDLEFYNYMSERRSFTLLGNLPTAQRNPWNPELLSKIKSSNELQKEILWIILDHNGKKS